MSDRVLVVGLCLKYFQGLAELYHSIVSDVNWQPYIVDNWRRNRGVSKSWNQSLEFAQEKDYDYVLICNDDILLAPYVLDGLVEVFNSLDEKTALISPRDARGFISKPDKILKAEPMDPLPLVPGEPNFSCFMVRSNFMDVYGGFDPRFWPAYFEDNDMHYRIRLLGAEAVLVPHLLFYHLGSHTQNLDPNNPVCSSPQFDKNKHYYVKKWGGPPGHEVYQTPFNSRKLTAKDVILA